MKTFKISEWLDSDSLDEGHTHLYVVRDGERVLYVGKASCGIASRWFGSRGHMIKNMGGYWMGFSPVGRAIVESFPQSRQWEIDLYEIAECLGYARKLPYRQNLSPDRLDIDDAEMGLIQELRPSLNVMGV